MQQQTKTAFGLVVAWIVAVLLHNVLTGLLGFEEPLFFILSFLIAFVFSIYFLYWTGIYLKDGKPNDWWQLGWLGLIGFLGLLPRIPDGFLIILVLLALIALKRVKPKKGKRVKERLQRGGEVNGR